MLKHLGDIFVIVNPVIAFILSGLRRLAATFYFIYQAGQILLIVLIPCLRSMCIFPAETKRKESHNQLSAGGSICFSCSIEMFIDCLVYSLWFSFSGPLTVN